MAKDFNKIQKPENSQDIKNGWEDVADYAPDLNKNTPEARLEARRRANLESLATKGVHSDIFESGVLDKNELFQELLSLDQDEFEKEIHVDSDGNMMFSKHEDGDLELINDIYFRTATEKNYRISHVDSGVVHQTLDEYRSEYTHEPCGGGCTETKVLKSKMEELLKFKGGELTYKRTAYGEVNGATSYSTPVDAVPGTATNKNIEALDRVVAISRDENDRTFGNIEYTKFSEELGHHFTARFSAPFHSEYPKYIDDMVPIGRDLDYYYDKQLNRVLENSNK